MISENSAKKPDHRTRPHSEESKRKASAAMRGRRNAAKPEQFHRISVSAVLAPATLAALQKIEEERGLSRGRAIDLCVETFVKLSAAGNV